MAAATRGSSSFSNFVLWVSTGCVGLLAAYFITSRGQLDVTGYAVGRDFANIWTASHMLLAGRIEELFDPMLFWAEQRALFGAKFPPHFWSYPPNALLLAAPFSLLPSLFSYALWCLGSFALFSASARAFFGDNKPILFLALAPSTCANLILGQNGFLTAALLVGGLALLERRPIAAGALFGLLVFKPQLGILLPFALAASHRFKALVAAAAAALFELGASVAVFGLDAWHSYFDTAVPYQLAMMAHGVGPVRVMMPTVLMSGRLLGLPAGPTYLLQSAVALAALAAVVWAFWRGRERRLQGAVLLVATVLVSPQAFNYDLSIVSVAVLVLARAPQAEAFDRLERWTMALAWVLPIAIIPLGMAYLPISPLVLAALLYCLLRRLAQAEAPP